MNARKKNENPNSEIKVQRLAEGKRIEENILITTQILLRKINTAIYLSCFKDKRSNSLAESSYTVV